jgi:hypothetical protein
MAQRRPAAFALGSAILLLPFQTTCLGLAGQVLPFPISDPPHRGMTGIATVVRGRVKGGTWCLITSRPIAKSLRKIFGAA